VSIRITSNEIDRQAADWAAKSERGQMPEALAPTFRLWLEADERHRGAYMKALAVQILVERVGRANRGLMPGGLAKRYRFPLRRIMMTGAIAASLLLAIAATNLVRTKTTTGIFATPVGAVRSVALPDGSVMTMNTGSKVEVDYTMLSRDITLSEGESLFDVAKNKLRPFRVAARGARVRAVGTSFSVKNVVGTPLEILVREGVVAIETSAPDGARTTKIPANTRALIDGSGSVRTETVSESEIQNAISWRLGYIFLAHRTLAEAAAEFARYSPIAIVIDDPAVASRVVSGLFKATDPVSFTKATALALHLDAVREGNTVRLAKKSD
jgi:transmembrane sensor